MSEQPVKFYVQPDGIMVFEFFALHRQAADLFAKIVRAGMDDVPDRLRIIYDFSQSPPPTGYFLYIQGKLYEEFPHPADEKVAYVTGKRNSDVWVRILRSYFKGKDTYKTFDTREEASTWLHLDHESNAGVL